MTPKVIQRNQTTASVYTGDSFCLLRELAPQWSGRRIHVVTDPPYCSGGVTRSERNASTSAKYQNTSTKKKYPDFTGDSRDSRSLIRWFSELMSPVVLHSAAGSHLICFTDWRQLPTFTDAIQSAGYCWRGCPVWDKTPSSRPIVGGFRLQAEFMIHGSIGPLDRSKGRPCLPGVFTCRIAPNEKHHLTAKPLALMKEIVRLAQPGDLILDPFCGSGTTLVAALEAGIDSVGIEMSEEYSAITATRLQQVAQ